MQARARLLTRRPARARAYFGRYPAPECDPLVRSDPVPAVRANPQAVEFRHVSLAFDDQVVLRDVSFSVRSGGMSILLGTSGAGKSVILKLILGLLKPDGGEVHIDGVRTDNMTEAQMMRVRNDIGMLFQEGALFDSLTVAHNVGYKLYEESDMPAEQARRRVQEVLGFIGLQEYIDRMPSELSGGQRRRVAIGRAMAGRPRLLLFDDPTSGLDPITAKTIDDEIIKLRDLQHVTSIVVTHQLQDAFYIATHEARQVEGTISIRERAEGAGERARFILLRDGRIDFDGIVSDLRKTRDPHLQGFLTGWYPPLV